VLARPAHIQRNATMRLLKLDDYPNFGLVDFAEDDCPPYAILSHTWGLDAEEVTYRDVIDETGSGKAGYKKLHFCALQAKNDGLKYCWIDTCCINKTNAAELTESINSMFRWYQNACRCYVFLADCSTPANEDDKDLQLRNSRWFTRGWTLQELIAPRQVEFFSLNFERLGDRKSLEKEIHQITGISVHALRGEPLSHFTVDERMYWSANRTTKRPEDKIYSLLGLFDVHMEAIYGEGEHHAYRRLLRELERYAENHHPSNQFYERIQSSATTPSDATLIKSTWFVPFERNSRFIGRELELARVEEMLLGKQRVAKLAITGLGGIGKTQLVIEVLYRVFDKQKHYSVIWISAVSAQSLHQSYLEIAQHMRIPGFEDDQADVKRLVQAHLSKESTGQWLLVFDNADDIDMWITKAEPKLQSSHDSHPLIEYLPKSKHGAIIFTTRDRKVAVKLAHQNVVDVTEMEEDMAAQLLKKCLINTDLTWKPQDMSKLLSQLTCLPLAIVQAAAYINENATSLAEYLALLSEQEEDVIDLLSEDFEDDERYRNIQNPVATTWLVSFRRIRRRNQLAAEYLSFMACIEPKHIPRSILLPGASRKKEVDAIGILIAYGFVIKDRSNEFLNLHRLVHLATRNWLRMEDQLAKSTEQALLRLQEVFPDEEHQNRTQWRECLAHVSYALASDVTDKDSDTRTRLLWKLGKCLFEDGRWKDAENAFIQVTDTYIRELGSEHPSTLTCMGRLASTYRNQGRWTDAEKIEINVIEMRKKVLGEEHLDTLTGMSNLAATYHDQGRWKEGEMLEVRVIEVRKVVLGEQHPDTLTGMANLALTYQYQGRWKEAEALSLQVIEARKIVLGEEHPHTLTSMSNLAITRCSEERWDEAEELDMRVLKIREKILGEEHPSTLVSVQNLASVRWNQERWKESEKLYVRAIEARKRVLGEEHPSTLTSLHSLASVYWKQGRWKEAEELETRVVETETRVLGKEHPETLASMANLAYIYKSRGRKDDAISLLAECCQLRGQVIGLQHPDTTLSLSTLDEWQQEDVACNSN
jgi:tetratricopeptide (TPR) repeat protein